MLRTAPSFAAIFLFSPLLLADTTATAHQTNTVVRSIIINGNDVLTERQILGAMILKPTSYFSLTQLRDDLERLVTLYRENGYYFASARVESLIIPSDSSAVDIVISVTEGHPTHIDTLTIEGNTAFTTDEILTLFDTKPGRVFDAARLERDIDELLHRYERRGYPFAQASVTNIAAKHDTKTTRLTVTLAIDEGTLVHINEIRVEGNKDTKTDVVVRETRLRTGEPYNEDNVKMVPQRLSRLNIFSSVSEPELYVNSRGGGLLIRVQEGNTNSFDGVAGYLPGGGGESGYFTGLVNVGMRNLFGTARKLYLRWQREDRLSQELALRYIEPWVLNYPVNLTGAFFQRQQDTTYVRRMLEFKADLMVTEFISLGALYSHENVIPSSTMRFLFNSSTITGGIEIQYDARDDPFSPTGGVLYRSDYRIGRKNVFGLPDTSTTKRTNTVQKIGLDVEWYGEVFQRQVVMLGLHGRELRSGNIELADLYRFGGTNTMRGYRENQFIGSRVVWSNAEYRFALARRSFLFGFFDTGYYFHPVGAALGSISTQQFKYGYGVGVRLETALGNIGVSFALGEGDSFSQGKIHFGLINEF